METKEKNLTDSLTDFLGDDIENGENNEKKVIIKNDNSIVERINKKVVTSDGRQLLVEKRYIL
jgi:hypothetical protein